jgi:hypothetical protein
MIDFFAVSEAKKVAQRLGADGLLKGAHLLGFVSKNKRKYAAEAVKKAVEDKLYNDLNIYLNHDYEAIDAGNGKRDNNISDKVGFVVTTSFDEKYGMIGDVQFNTGHPQFESVRWWVNNRPDKVGFSHVALQKETKGTVVDIVKPMSLDLVSAAATTSGIFTEAVKEAEEYTSEGVVDDNIASNRVNAICDAMTTLMYQVRWPQNYNYSSVVTPKLTQEEIAAKLIPILKDTTSELSKVVKSTKSEAKANNMEITEVTLEMLKKDRPDLVTALSTEAVSAERAIDAKVIEAVKTLDEKAKSKVFLTLVRESIVAGKDVTELVADRKEATKVAVESATIQAPEKKEEKPATEATKAVEISDDAILRAANK